MKMTQVVNSQSSSCFLPKPLEGEAARVDFIAWGERGARAGNDGKKNFFPSRVSLLFNISDQERLGTRQT